MSQRVTENTRKRKGQDENWLPTTESNTDPLKGAPIFLRINNEILVLKKLASLNRQDDEQP